MSKHREIQCTNSSILDLYELEGDPKEVIERLQTLIDTCDKQGHTDLYIEIGNEYNYGDYETCVYLNYKRKETDKERDKRDAQAKKNREKKAADKLKREEKERADYERLSKKYG